MCGFVLPETHVDERADFGLPQEEGPEGDLAPEGSLDVGPPQVVRAWEAAVCGGGRTVQETNNV